MLADYSDIRSRITEQPKWFDSNGVPRYDEFHPDLGPNIYADESALLEIACQSCAQKFIVSMEMDQMDRHRRKLNLADLISSGHIHYGDPPRHGESNGCLAGDTMNCEDIRVLQFWRKENFKWKRVPEFEITLPDASGQEFGE